MFRLLFFFFAIFLAFLSMSDLTISASGTGIEAAIYSRIQSAFEQQNYELVEDNINRLVRLNPNHEGIRFYTARIAYKRGDYDKAYQIFETLVDSAEYSSISSDRVAKMNVLRRKQAFYNELNRFIEGNSYSQALNLLEQWLSDFPYDETALFKAAYIAAVSGYQGRAESFAQTYYQNTDDLSSAIELNNFIKSWFQLGISVHEAIEILLDLDFDKYYTRPVLNRLSNHVRASGNFEQLQRFFDIKKKFDGVVEAEVQLEFVNLLIELGKYEKALDTLAQKSSQSVEDKLLKARILGRTFEELESLSVAQEVMDIAPNNLNAYYVWLETWLAYYKRNHRIIRYDDDEDDYVGQTASHIASLFRPDVIAAQKPELLINITRVALIMRKNEKFEEFSEFLPQIDYNSYTAGLLIDASDEFAARNRLEAIKEAYVKAVRDLPGNENLRYELAQVYYQLNDYSNSLIVLRELLGQNPDMIRAFFLLIDVKEAKGLVEEAIESIQQKIEDGLYGETVLRQLSSRYNNLRVTDDVDEEYSD